MLVLLCFCVATVSRRINIYILGASQRLSSSVLPITGRQWTSKDSGTKTDNKLLGSAHTCRSVPPESSSRESAYCVVWNLLSPRKENVHRDLIRYRHCWCSEWFSWSKAHDCILSYSTQQYRGFPAVYNSSRTRKKLKIAPAAVISGISLASFESLLIIFYVEWLGGIYQQSQHCLQSGAYTGLTYTGSVICFVPNFHFFHC